MRRATRSHRFRATALFCGLLVAAGCDRGSRPEQLGRPAPLFALNDGQHAVSSNDLRGHVVLLNFWASWCAPCLAEMPALQALQHEVPGVRVIGVAFDEDAPTYQAYLTRHPVTFLTVLDEHGTMHTSFGTFRPPETYVIDKAGVIRHKYIGAQDWTSPEIVDTLRQLVG